MTENPVESINPVGEALAAINRLTDSQLEEVGRSLSTASLTRLTSQSLGGKMGGALRKLVGLGVLLVLLAVLGFIWAYFNSTKNIASGERNTKQADWGYAVEQYRFRDRMRLNLWSDSSLFSGSSQATFDLSSISISRILEERWLAESRAVYLSMLVHTDELEQPAKVIYDFQRGEMYMSSPANLWRVPNEGDKNLKMTEAEFQAVLNSYSGSVPAAAAPSASVSATPNMEPSVSPSVSASPSVTPSAAPSPTN